MENITVVKKTENDGRQWYSISGRDGHHGWELDSNYGVTDDGTILDCDGYPLTPGDPETIAVINAIERI